MKKLDGNEKARAEGVVSPSAETGGPGASQWREFLATCGNFASYTSPRMRELLFCGDGQFKSAPIS